MGEDPEASPDPLRVGEEIVEALDAYVILSEADRTELARQIANYLADEAVDLDERRFLFRATRAIFETVVRPVLPDRRAREERKNPLSDAFAFAWFHAATALRLGRAYGPVHADGRIMSVRENGELPTIKFPVAGFPTEGLPERDDDVEDWLDRCRAANPPCPACGDVRLYFMRQAWGHDPDLFETPGGGWLHVVHGCPACELETEFRRKTHVDRLSEETKDTMPALDHW